ncbi:ABC transporter permease [Rhodoferax sp. U11-2br]|uniref:ABC transporter permease n=1 Tax=Rhodoferax sp. U11-2br TaxID=2838878 RepID=UPI001BEC7966|nr:ABC transporter permease [Rhodoferax sp. U11-2br]MBT3067805.1 ABC transporter permease [Rhodoferax sp. U11-2br]
MTVFNPFPIVRADFRRNLLLVWVTVMLVALSVATGIAVISQERALREGSARAADDFDVLIGAPGSATQLVLTTVYLRPQAMPLMDGGVLAKLVAAEGIKYAAPIAFGDNWQGHPIVGTIADFASRGGTLSPTQGRLFERQGEAVVGADVPLEVGAHVSPAHGLHHDEDEGEDHDSEEHHGVSYTVVGRLPARHTVWDRAILVPVEDVWQVHGLVHGHDPHGDQHIGPPWDESRLAGVPAIAVKPNSVGAAYHLRGAFQGTNSLALFPAEVLNDLYVTLGNVRDMMSVLAITTQVLVVIAVLMALLVGFLARQRQFAVLRAMGAGRVYVFSVVWLEVVSLVVLGAALGTALGWGGSVALSHWLQSQLGFVMPVRLGAAEALLVGGLVVSGALIGLLPAWLTFRRSIAEGLVTA